MSSTNVVPVGCLDRVREGYTITGLVLPNDDDANTRGLGWRLSAYSAHLEGLFCEVVPQPHSDWNGLLDEYVDDVRDWDTLGELFELQSGNSHSERVEAVALASAFGLLWVDRFLRSWMSGASTLDLILAWDRVCDAVSEVAGQFQYLRFEDGTFERREFSRKGGAAKHANSPYAKAKEFVRECWLDWELHPDNYPSLAAFARDMMEKLPNTVLNPVTFERWVRGWRLDTQSQD